MAGGLGRAQGPYDEMVFRSMVLDGSRFYDPLGLASELTKTDFQVEANSYLYGTRFMNYLAYTYEPESLIRWTSRTAVRRRTTRRRSSRCTACRSSRPGATGLTSSRRFQRRNIDCDPRASDDAVHGCVARGARFAVARLRRSRAPHDLRRPELPRHCGLPRRHRARRWPRRAPAGHQAAAHLHGDVAGLRSGVAHAVLYRRQHGVSRPHGARHGDTTAADAAEGRADRRSGRSTARDRSLWGIRTFNGICTLVRIPEPYTELERDLLVAVRRNRLRPRRLARWRSGVSVGRRDQRHADACGS